MLPSRISRFWITSGAHVNINAIPGVDDLMQLFKKARYEAERIRHLLAILEYCGFQVQNAHGQDNRIEVDGAFTAKMNDRMLRFVLEMKLRADQLSIESAIRHVQNVRYEGRFDRALIVIPDGIPERYKRLTESTGLGYMDILGGPDLQSWIAKNAPTSVVFENPVPKTCAMIIRFAMREIAERLAHAPRELWDIEWRDLERVLREVFEGMGFETNLTRSSKDGGFDLSLEAEQPDGKHLYLVEVKHWTTQTPGKAELKKLVRVTAKEQARKGILLSSSGFSPSIYQGISEIERQTVGLGSAQKIVGLCKTYYRLGSQLWTSENDLVDELLSGLQ